MGVSQLIIQILNALSYAALLFLISSGLSVIFGLMRIINLAHGSFFLLGAYIGLTVVLKTGSFLLAALLAGLAIAALGVLLERLFFRALLGRELDQVLLTLGFAYIIRDAAKWVWGAIPQSIPKPAIFAGSVAIMGNSLPTYRLAMIGIGAIVALLLWLFLDRTRLGAIVRAGVDDKQMVTGLGVNISLVFSIVVALGSFLAAFGGFVGGPISGAYQGLDFDVLILALAVVIVGGLGSLKGPLLGSLLIGFIDTFGKVLFPNFNILTIYVAMTLILLIKPRGLWGSARL